MKIDDVTDKVLRELYAGSLVIVQVVCPSAWKHGGIPAIKVVSKEELRVLCPDNVQS